MKPPCVVPGCGKARKAKGLCQTHYKGYQRSGVESVPEFVEQALGRAAVSQASRPAAVDEERAADEAAELELRLARARQEWADWKFPGGKRVADRKREVLAHLELVYYWVVACDRAEVRRTEYLAWRDGDEKFAAAEVEATEAACQRAEYQMLATGAPLNGRVNPKALIMWLNKYAEWNPQARGLDMMRNARLVEGIARILRETLPPDAAEQVIRRVDGLAGRADRLPPGSRL